jgi:hypothetical protein
MNSPLFVLSGDSQMMKRLIVTPEQAEYLAFLATQTEPNKNSPTLKCTLNPFDEVED